MAAATAEMATRNGNGSGELSAPRPQRVPAIVQDEGQFANLLDSNKFDHLWRVATLFSKTQLVPKHFQGHAEDCFIATSMAIRLGVDPFMFMQNTYIVYGRPGMEAKLAIALINSSGYFTDPLDYEISGGEDPNGTNYKVRAFATRKSTGKIVHGPWIDWKMVKAEKWNEKDGSKWKTIPGLMFQYRAATFFGRLHCPERLMGMQTVDELKDADLKQVESTVVSEAPKRPFGPPVVQHPTDDTRKLDTSTSNLSPEEAEAVIKSAPRAGETQDPQKAPEKEEIDVTGTDAESPLPDLSTFELFHEAMESLAANTMSSADFSAGMTKLAVNYAIKRPTTGGARDRKLVYVAASAGQLDWVNGKILE